MTDLAKFIEIEEIPSHYIWIYHKNGKKTPIGEKNTADLETVRTKFSNGHLTKDKPPSSKLNKEERKTLYLAHTLFLKYTDNLFCIDVDDENVTDMEKFRQSTYDEFPKIYQCPFVKGNTKGIHIYVRINGMHSYTDEIDVFEYFTGDCIKDKKNMWEKADKKIENYNGSIPTINYDEIKSIFNEKINKEKKKKQKKQEVNVSIEILNEKTEKENVFIIKKKQKKQEVNESLKDDGLMDDYQYALNVGIQGKMCQKGQFNEWLTIGQILKNERGDEGRTLFVEWSSFWGEDEKYKTLEHQLHCADFYDKKIKKQPDSNKNKLGLKKLKYYVKEYNSEAYVKRWGSDNGFNEIPTTQYKQAELFKHLYGNNFRSCKDGKKDINFYFYNDNNLWEVTDINKIILKISNDLKNHIETLKFDKDKKDKIIEKLETHGDASSVAKYVSKLIDHKDFDKDINKQKYVLPIKNKKIIDLRNNQVRDRTPDDKFDYECDAFYLENMTPETEGWKYAEKYFLDLFCNNEKITQVFLNTIKSCLQGFPIKNLFIAIGPNGNNGKSFLFNLLRTIFGKAFDVVSPDIIIKNKSGSSGINTQFEKIEKCRLGYMTEPDKGDVLNSKDIKKITGKDGIDLRALWATNRTIFATCSLWLLTNVLPNFTVEKGINNRLCLFPFNAEFKENPDFEDEINTKFNEIFTYIMKKGKVTSSIEMTPEMIAIKEKYINDNDRDTLRDFIKTKTIITEGKKITRDEMRKRFNEYCQANGFSNETRNWSPNKFTSSIKEYGIEYYNKGENRCYFKNIDWIPNYYGGGEIDIDDYELQEQTEQYDIEYEEDDDEEMPPLESDENGGSQLM
jgi:P4 family phage/plasmid primase-like protien